MEYRLSVDGDPITEWERVRAADVNLWKRSIWSSLQLDDVKIDVESRKIPDAVDLVVVDIPDSPPLQTLTKAELRAIADAQGITAPKAATNLELIDLIRKA